MNEIESLELKISKFLRWGVLLSALFMLVGWIIELKWRGNPFFHFEIYDELALKNQLGFHLRKKNWGHLISFFGLIILISLPVIRVFLTGLVFIKQKEYPLASIAFTVLLGLILSFGLGITY